jgi:glycosyltransferase involved in cell wall biosynthesis
VAALARLPADVELHVAGYETVSSTGYLDRLFSLAGELGVANRFVSHGAIPLGPLLEATAEADVGVVALAGDFNEPMVGASVKPFEYLACGLPLLTNRTPEWEDFFGASGVALACDPDDPDDIASAVRQLRDDPERRLAMAARGSELIRSQWNYEVQFAKVLEVLDA